MNKSIPKSNSDIYLIRESQKSLRGDLHFEEIDEPREKYFNR